MLTKLLYLPLALVIFSCSPTLEGQQPFDDCTPPSIFEACQADESLCTELSGPVCDDTRSDGGGSSSIPDWWFERAGACYDDKDYACVERYFGILAWGGWLKGYTYASSAMSKFLDCETETLEIPEVEVKKDWEVSVYNDEGFSSLKWALIDSEWELTEMAEQATLSIGESIEIPLSSRLTASGNEDVRKTLGRFHIQGKAVVTRIDDFELQYAITYDIKDRYDWHPQRVTSAGQVYDEAHPYHSWASKLVDLGLACEFDMHAGWTDTGSIHSEL